MSKPKRHPRSGLWSKRLLRDCRGAALVEFSIVALLFLVVAFGIIDVGLELFTQEMLDNATRDAAREIRIGASGYTTACSGTGCKGSSITTITSNVKTLICGEVPIIPKCTTNLQIYIASAASGQLTGLAPGYGFAGTGHVVPATITGGGGTLQSSTATVLTGNYDVILEAGYYRPWIAFFAKYIGASSKLMVLSLLAFQTEPY